MPSLSRRLRSSFARPRRRLVPVVAVFAGGLVGSGAREAIAEFLPGAAGGLPADLLVVNLVGSLLLGWYLVRRERAVGGRRWSPPFWAVGVTGSFTTFSAFSLEVVQLIQADRAGVAGAYVLASVFGGLVFGQFGQRLARVS